MARYILEESKIHPAALQKINDSYRSFLEGVIKTVETDKVVVIGMAQNPNCKRACKILDRENITYTYLEYGNYLKEWRKRNSIKMWSGWKTFPMVFVQGTLIGGADDLQALIKNGDFNQLATA